MRSGVHIIAAALILSTPLLADEALATVLTVSAPDVRKGEVRVASGAGLDDDEHTLVADVSVGVTDAGGQAWSSRPNDLPAHRCVTRPRSGRT